MFELKKSRKYFYLLIQKNGISYYSLGGLKRVKSSLGADVKVNLAEDEEIGWCNKAMEAQIFAYLAVRALQGRPISVPETTKVLIPLSGGNAYCPIQGVTENIKNLLEKNLDVLSGYQDK